MMMRDARGTAHRSSRTLIPQTGVWRIRDGAGFRNFSTWRKRQFVQGLRLQRKCGRFACRLSRRLVIVSDGSDESKKVSVRGGGGGPVHGFMAIMKRVAKQLNLSSPPPRMVVPKHWVKKMKDFEKVKKMSKDPRNRQHLVNSYYAAVAKIQAFEQILMRLSDEELRAKTGGLKKRVKRGESLDNLLPEAFAVVRETSRRVLDMRHYDCQMIGGIVLHEGNIAEMETGEGKTLVATLPAYLNAVDGKKVHVVTVNEYLAKRDANWMGRVYEALGLSVSAVVEDMSIEQRKKAYKADVVYITAQQLCFDYLRDRCAMFEESIAQGSLDYAIVDEVDSILIDESRNPMILSDKSSTTTDKALVAAEICYELLEEQNYNLLNRLGNLMSTISQPEKVLRKGAIDQMQVRKVREALVLLIKVLTETRFLSSVMSMVRKQFPSSDIIEELTALTDTDMLENPDCFRVGLDRLLVFKTWVQHGVLYVPDVHSRNVTITERGAQLLQTMLEWRGEVFTKEGAACLWESSTSDAVVWGPFLKNAFKAYEHYHRNHEYILREGRVIILDESTQRPKEMSRWEDGLHQAVEAMEKVLEDRGVQREGRMGEGEVTINPENYTIASVTFQVFFRYYKKLAGMSGTAVTEQSEFHENYALQVFSIPTHNESRRVDQPHVIFMEPAAKMSALVCELAKTEGVRPVLIGTNSIEESEVVLNNLRQTWKDANGKIVWDGEDRHDQGKLLMLNARPEVIKAEAQIIAQAGLPGMITISTRMAGRGTDILLGGNPKGLTESALYRLVFSKMINDRGKLGGIPRVPLAEFKDETSQQSSLPPSVFGKFKRSLIHAGHAGGSEEFINTLQDAERAMEGVMDEAEKLRRSVMAKLRPMLARKRCRLMDLEYEGNIRSAIKDVWMAEEGRLEKQSPLRQMLIEAAVYGWLWFEQKCEEYGEQVRNAGGLLVIGMSLAESKRIELQLRGRAGRQGDPGDSMMFSDLSDPMFRIWSFEGVTRILESGEQLFGGRIEGFQANMIINQLRALPTKLNRRMRGELVKYDEVNEEFRQQHYYLRDIILRGSHQQRTQWVYSWIQDFADMLVDKYCSPHSPPSKWDIFGVRWNTSEHTTIATSVANSLEDCLSIEEALEFLFNPPSATIMFEEPNMKKRVSRILAREAHAKDEDIAKLGIERSGNWDGTEKRVQVRMMLIRVIPITPAMQEEIKETLSVIRGRIPPRSPAQHFAGAYNRQPMTIELRHALLVHKEMQRQQQSGDDAVTRGRYGKHVDFLREYLGELMIMLFEERKSQILDALCQEDDHLMIDARSQLEDVQKRTMLDFLDVFWAEFQAFTNKLRSSSSVRAMSNSTPLEEYSIEAHREYTSTLEMYRKSVVMNVVAPQINISPHSSFPLQRELFNSQQKDQEKQLEPPKQEADDTVEDVDGDSSIDGLDFDQWADIGIEYRKDLTGDDVTVEENGGRDNSGSKSELRSGPKTNR